MNLRALVRAWLGVWTLAFAGAAFAQAIPERQLIELAGQGRYEDLADRLAPRSSALSTGELHALCYAYSRTKSYRLLLACLDRLESAVRNADRRDKATLLFGLDDATPTVYLMRAEAWLDLGEPRRSGIEAERALAWFDKEGGAGERDIQIDALAALAIAGVHAKDAHRAVRYLTQLEKLKLDWFADPNLTTVRSFALARAYLALEQYPRACDALAADKSFDFRKSLEEKLHFSPGNWVWQQLPRSFLFAKCRFGMGRLAEAKESYDALLRLPSVRQTSGIYWMILFDRGRIAESEGDIESAIRFYREAIEVFERLRSSINTEASKIGFVADKQSVYGALIGLLLERKRADEALEYADRAKARALVDLLADRFVPASVQRLDRGDPQLAALLEQHRQAEEVLMRQVPRDDAVRDRQRLTLAAVTLGIRKSAPELASLISAVPASAAELTRQLDPGEVGVQYFVHGEKLYALTFGAGGTRGFVLDGAGLADEVERFRALMMRIHPGANVLGQALYRRLIAPLESVIAGKPLLIVPHASLHYVPFAALSDGKRYLAQKHALRVMSSASALQYLRRPVEASAAAALILGNPTLDLPSAEEEARKLGKLIAGARVLVGPQATKQALIVGGGNYRTIHIASHGEYDPDQPLESRLLLAQSGASVSIAGGEKAAGILKVTEVYGLRLQADLVTLSSCESGLGRITDGGDVIGLTRGFLYAGANTVVASLWKVADDATLELMERFYANLARMDKREALRSAQIETARKFPHPFFWAAFYLTGVGR